MLFGDSWGTSTSTQFYLPDLRGRVPVGRDASQTEFDTLGESGGSKTHTLTTAEMPSHNHTFTRTSNGLPMDIAGGGVAGNGISVTATVFASSTVITNTGGGGAHNNLSPYRVINYIVKT
jgi:microcystin-dependent protein